MALYKISYTAHIKAVETSGIVKKLWGSFVLIDAPSLGETVPEFKKQIKSLDARIESIEDITWDGHKYETIEEIRADYLKAVTE